MKLCRRVIRTNDLVLVATAESFQDNREPPLSTGNFVRLNSGSPRLLVVDTSDDAVTVAWRDGAGLIHEQDFPRACLHRLP
jgi:uncharacterized protein YodC (DUF2158 family)